MVEPVSSSTRGTRRSTRWRRSGAFGTTSDTDGSLEPVQERDLAFREAFAGEADRDPLEAVHLGELPRPSRTPWPVGGWNVLLEAWVTSRSASSAHTMTRLPPGWRSSPRNTESRTGKLEARLLRELRERRRPGDPHSRRTPPSAPSTTRRPSWPRRVRRGRDQDLDDTAGGDAIHQQACTLGTHASAPSFHPLSRSFPGGCRSAAAAQISALAVEAELDRLHQQEDDGDKQVGAQRPHAEEAAA